MRKVATSRKSKRYGLIDNEKQDSFRFVSVCDFQDDLSPAIAKILAQGLQGYNTPADWAGKVFNPSTDSESLLVEIKFFFHFGFGVLWGRTSQVGVSFSFLA